MPATAGGIEGSEKQSTSQLSTNEKFFRYFQHEVTDIQEKIDKLSSFGSTGGERPDAVEHCLASIARLSDEVKDASSYTPAYDQRTYGEAIKALSAKLQETRATFAPRPKFSFKKSGPVFTAQKNESAISLTDAATLAIDKRRQRQPPGYGSDLSSSSSFATTPVHLHSPNTEAVEDSNNDGSGNYNNDIDQPRPTGPNQSSSHIRQPSFSQSNTVNISSHDGKHIVLPASAARATRTSGTLVNLHRCVIDMSTPTSATVAQQPDSEPFAGGLTLRNVSSSLLICGRVAGAVHLTRLTNCVVVVAARQFRMHDAKNCDVYLTSASKPIIEDCAGIRFAPLPSVCGLQQQQGLDDETAPNGGGEDDGGKGGQGLWREVQDFKFLHAGEQSPNWSILRSGERIRTEVWRDVVPGGPGLGTEDVLAAVGIQK